MYTVRRAGSPAAARGRRLHPVDVVARVPDAGAERGGEPTHGHGELRQRPLLVPCRARAVDPVDRRAGLRSRGRRVHGGAGSDVHVPEHYEAGEQQPEVKELVRWAGGAASGVLEVLHADWVGIAAQNVFLKVGDLVFQGLVLHRTLNEGFPGSLSIGYAYFFCLNGLSCVYNIISAKNSAFTEVLVDSMYVAFSLLDSKQKLISLLFGRFDLGAAVLFPIMVLGYCTYYFEFDRAVFLINVEVLDEGTFDRFARMQADPAQVALFLINFNSLRVKNAIEFILAIGMNLSFCHRLSRIVDILATHRGRVQDAKLGATRAAVDETKRSSHQKPVPRWFALPFLLTSIFAVVYTHQAIDISSAAGAAYPQCVAFSHIWDSGVNCSCIMLIDTDRVPRSAQDWYYPVDATDIVRSLATAGTLQGLQLINRQLRQFPEDLHRCTNLETMYVVSGLCFPHVQYLNSTSLVKLFNLHEHGRASSLGHRTQAASVLCLAADDPRRANPATLKTISRFPHTICQRTPLPLAIEALSDTPSPERIAMCGGKRYRQCEIPGVTSSKLLGMCYSARMQVVACNVDQPFIQVRRVQIDRGVGVPCDPQEEAWLGCKSER
ncbi:unnamed protein product [Phytophthora fragariaefolia]|uniref:Unnamed protein product n=1 Tax=Phytophthora fragariaefolia TaxID=1490495 RepID=A0A9W6XHT2_9STRA|nr:unnamed protein product [Phytophthora fragariaefolia]